MLAMAGFVLSIDMNHDRSLEKGGDTSPGLESCTWTDWGNDRTRVPCIAVS